MQVSGLKVDLRWKETRPDGTHEADNLASAWIQDIINLMSQNFQAYS